MNFKIFNSQGGPMVRLSDNVLIGVVSFGIGCTDHKFPAVYGRVSSVRSWIRKYAQI